jgi:glycogen debranching enzyme
MRPLRRLRAVLSGLLVLALAAPGPAAAQVVALAVSAPAAPLAGVRVLAGPSSPALSASPIVSLAPALSAGFAPSLAPSLAAAAAVPSAALAAPAEVPAAAPAAAVAAAAEPSSGAPALAAPAGALPALASAGRALASASASGAKALLLDRFFAGADASAAAAAPAAEPAGAFVSARSPALAAASPPRADAAWWKDSTATRRAVTVPLYALRRGVDDPGIGKYSDLGRYYRETLAPQGVDAVLLLPHFATRAESPYAPVSLDAVSEDAVDWSSVDEVRARPDLLARLRAGPGGAQKVDYADVRARESGVARAAFEDFSRGELARGGARADDYRRFLTENSAWLDEYAEFMALSARIGKPALDWTEEDVARARADAGFARDQDAHRFSQWVGRAQLRAALDEIHRAGGKAIFDVPMFRSKDGVDAWQRPELFTDLRTRNPGVINAWVHEDWGDLALWNWTRLKQDGYRPALAPFERWLDFGFDGARVDALHFAYQFGNGQLASGDEPGDDYVKALGEVFSRRGAFPLAEAFEGKATNALRYGFVTVGGNWKKMSSHDDPRSPDFLERYFRAASAAADNPTAKFVAWTLGDEWRDPFPVKELRNGRSYWEYRIPLPSDPDYKKRARFDARPQLRVMNSLNKGDAWKDPEAVRTVLAAAADGFVKHEGGSVQIWAASMDWFLEEWGRDTFVSLPGLLLSTGRFDEAKESIRRFSRFEHDGLIPNKIWDASRWSPQNPDGADYNTIDGPMWFVQAVQKTAEASGDPAFADELAPVIRRIMARYEAGTGYERYGRFNRIYMDSDGLVVGPAQATWMDADPEGRDRPVTPRDGKAVEINALWYANLRFLAELERRAGAPAAAKSADALADRVKASFNEKFWFETEDNRAAWGESGGALRDVVDGDPHGGAIRPNMLFAVSHGGDLLDPARRRAVVLAATKDLLTPYGLRTLSPRDSQYRARYDTSLPPLEKDLAYHQGTVWPWLMGPYADALARVRRDQNWSEDRIRAETRGLMTPLVRALASRPEGSLPEVFDGGVPDARLAGFSLDDPGGLGARLSDVPSGQNPGGTRSQAWSVAEALRVIVARGLVAPGYDGSR